MVETIQAFFVVMVVLFSDGTVEITSNPAPEVYACRIEAREDAKVQRIKPEVIAVQGFCHMTTIRVVSH